MATQTSLTDGRMELLTDHLVAFACRFEPSSATEGVWFNLRPGAESDVGMARLLAVALNDACAFLGVDEEWHARDTFDGRGLALYSRSPL